MSGSTAPGADDIEVDVIAGTADGKRLLETAEVVPEEKRRQPITTRIRRRQHVQELGCTTNRAPRADVIIASRYVKGGGAEMPKFRAVLSRILNVTFTKAFRMPIHDISSGFRLYHGETLKRVTFQASDFDVLEEILILIYIGGGTVTEVPFMYRPRQAGKSHAKLIQFGIAYARTFWKMWKLRTIRR